MQRSSVKIRNEPEVLQSGSMVITFWCEVPVLNLPEEFSNQVMLLKSCYFSIDVLNQFYNMILHVHQNWIHQFQLFIIKIKVGKHFFLFRIIYKKGLDVSVFQCIRRIRCVKLRFSSLSTLRIESNWYCGKSAFSVFVHGGFRSCEFIVVQMLLAW